jgi:periplasmic protein TonB
MLCCNILSEGESARPEQEEDDVMAYTDLDTNKPFSPASFSAAMLINGGMIALIVFAAPSVMQKISYNPTKLIDIYTPPPQPIVEPHRDVKEAAKAPTAHTLATPPVDEAKAKSDFVLTGSDTAIDPGPGLTDIKPFPGVDVIRPHVPVLTGSAIDARFANALQPTYPPGLQRAEIEGRVTVRVLIGTDGRVKAVEAVRADRDEFLAATRAQAMRKWRFKPATEDGAPIESWREMTVTFRIDS